MDADFSHIAERINTSSLQSGDAPTRALVVFNTTGETICGRVRFGATFPMRREACPLPVTVRDYGGQIVPSRLTVSEIFENENLPVGRVVWKMELEFVAEEVPIGGWRTFAAIFGFSLESQSENDALFTAHPLFSVPVIETECHSGDLPLVGLLKELQ